MANIFDVAKYILAKNGSMSTMKLQKLCFYSQAWSLVWDDCELFPEEFEAWANGPVCKELFFKHQGEFSVGETNTANYNLSDDGISDTQKDTINTVLDYYGDKNGQWLSTLTHMEDPWKEARRGVPDGAACDRVISKESMGMYYGSL